MLRTRPGLSRRTLLLGSAAVALYRPAIAWETAPLSGQPGPALEEFDYTQVTIEGELQQAQLANVRSILLGLNEDSLLAPFRQMSGLAAPGQTLGGWYAWKPDYDPHHDDAGLAPGSTFGQWLSAMARLHAATGDPALGARVQRLTSLLTQTANQGDLRGYFSQTRFAAYSFDKLVCGLMDAHRLVHDPSALPLLDTVRAAAEPSLAGHAVDRDTQSHLGRDTSWMWDESYTLPENLYLVSRMMPRDQGPRYRSMAEAYLDDATYFQPLARGKDVLGDKHAYSYVNALCSAMQAWLTGGSAMHLEAARNGFAFLEQQSFATAGWGPDELLRKPAYDEVAKSLAKSHNSFEVPCGSYAHMKLTRYLLRATGDGRYGDSMERVMLNAALGVLPLQPDGRSFYSADYSYSGKRVYSDHLWPCCSGTFPQLVADYGINTYFREPARAGRPAAVWVNLYQPSELRWQEGDSTLSLQQTGSYPESGQIHLRLTASRPVSFALRLRIPAWTASAFTLKVNGIPQAGAVASLSRGFASVARAWQSGDTVDLVFTLGPRLEPIPGPSPGHPDLAALLWGPLVLFALREPGDPTPLRIPARALLAVEPAGPRAWRIPASAGAGERRFVPFSDLADQAYSTYINSLPV